MDGLSILRDAISTLPVPAAPPRLSMEGAAVGLGFLDAALRLNHVRRLTERLTISQHRIAHRFTEVDVSINMLTDTQLGAAKSFQTLTSQSSTPPASLEDALAPVLWVPVARLSRISVGQVDVSDASGRRLPRLTQYETSRLIASGLYRLLRGILVSHRDATNVDTNLGAVLYRVHEPRWLIQSAILTILTEVSKPSHEPNRAATTERPAPGSSDPYRQMALKIFDTYAPLLDDFVQLLDVAVNDHILVVALDSARDEHLLNYESPLYVAKQDTPLERLWRLLRASREGYYVRYITDIPTTLRSYHLVAESAPGVNIGRILLTTNAHEKEVNALSRDLDDVAKHLDNAVSVNSTGEPTTVVRLEILVLLRQLAELMRRCRWEAGSAGVSPPQRCVSACSALVAVGEHYETSMRVSQAGDQANPPQLKLSPGQFRQAAAEIDKYELRYDVSVETQPMSNHAHVYWRRPPPAPVASGRTQIRAGMLLRNTAETSARTVLIYAIAVAGLAFVLACLVTRTLWPYLPRYDRTFAALPDREAVVAVALLVPGFLYTRLELPEHNSVASHLRTVPRLVAYVCIVSAVALAADVAAGKTGWFTQIVFVAASAIPLAATTLLIRFGHRYGNALQALARLDAPRWATDEDARDVRRLRPDVEYSSPGDST